MLFIFILIAIILTSVAVTVILSYHMVWYEWGNRNPELLERRFAPKTLWFVAKLVAAEIFWLLVTVLAHPLGWFPQKKGSAKETPVIFLHGLFHNRSCWFWLQRRLARRGVGPMESLNFNTWRDLESLTERLAKHIDALRLRLGVDKVHLVGHSMGGLVARNYIQLRGGAAKVESCLTIGTPHGGSRLAPFALSPLGKILVPGSEFLQRLEAATVPESVKFCTIYSRHDNMVLPHEFARFSAGQNIELHGVGHSGLLYDARTAQALIEFLGRKKNGNDHGQQP